MNSLALPPLYRPWVDEILGQPVYSEPRATCDNCVMCTFPEQPAKADRYFNINTKCCSYHPSIPNFLVGAILEDDDPNFAEGKEQFIKGALGAIITPLGTEPTFMTSLFYNLKPFGKYEKAICPFYINRSGGLCAIYKYRNVHCSAYFCKHERGRTGWRFWRKLENMLGLAEKLLSKYCVDKLEVIIPPNASNIRQSIWGNWTLREPEFFLKCWQIVRPMTWSEVLEVSGDDVKSLSEELKILSAKLKGNEVVEKLKLGSFESEVLANGMVRIWAYSKYNPIDLPNDVVDLLNYFDGSLVSEVLQKIEKETAVKIEPSMMLSLTDYEILIPAE